MKNILIPVDFTEVSLNAIQYAMDAYPDAQYKVVHATSGLIDLDQPVYLKPGKTQIQVIYEELEEMIKSKFNYDKIPENISIEVKSGAPVVTILKFLEDDIDCVMVGTRDKYDFFDRWIGTISLGIVKGSNKPVYLIPRYAAHNGVKKVMIASDYHLESSTLVRKIKQWNMDHLAFLKFLHISESEKQDFDKAYETIVNSMLLGKEPEFGFEVSVLNSKNVSESLLASAYNFGADLLMVLPEKKSFMHSMLFKNLSKELIMKSDIPILFMN